MVPQLPSSSNRYIGAQFTNSSVNKQNMAQSAVDSPKTPLQFDVFWEKPTITSPLAWANVRNKGNRNCWPDRG